MAKQTERRVIFEIDIMSESDMDAALQVEELLFKDDAYRPHFKIKKKIGNKFGKTVEIDLEKEGSKNA